MPDFTTAAAIAIFVATYVIVALGRMPVYRIDRAGVALLGGALMVGTGVLTMQEAYRAVDISTVTLLCSCSQSWPFHGLKARPSGLRRP
ncbi:MAG: hypothetical protein P8Y53_20025 [Pseudolabrys sp.]|jgi:Na+/H+ antiporter NhaD/arsenite permease-like protein